MEREPMSDQPKETTAKQKMPENISLRRGEKVMLNYSTRMLFQAIKKGKLLATDEYSLDGQHWVKLGIHKQLGKYLKKTASSSDEPDPGNAVDSPSASNNETSDASDEAHSSPPPGLNDELQKMADLLKGINSDS